MLDGIHGLSPTFQHHIQMVRYFMRDHAELNLLIRGEESSDRFIACATSYFLSDFNMAPPQTWFGIDEMYAPGWLALCLDGTMVALLKSLMIFTARNAIPFNDGGISVNFNDKSGTYMQLANFIQSAYEQNKRMLKMAYNIGQLLAPDSTGLFSDYSAIASSYAF